MLRRYERVAQNEGERQPYRLGVTLLACAVLLTTAVVSVVGWGMDVAAVRSVFPGAVGMKFQTAAGLAAAAAALLALTPGSTGVRRRAGLALATLPAVLAVVVLA